MKKLLFVSCGLLILALILDVIYTSTLLEFLRYAYCACGILGAVGILAWSFKATKKKKK